jgi:hypothetical protein
MFMPHELSPQTEQYLASIVAGGLFPSKEAALEAAVESLRNSTDAVPMVPAEHMAAVEEGLASFQADGAKELTDADWELLREHVRETVRNYRPGPP